MCGNLIEEMARFIEIVSEVYLALLQDCERPTILTSLGMKRSENIKYHCHMTFHRGTILPKGLSSPGAAILVLCGFLTGCLYLLLSTVSFGVRRCQTVVFHSLNSGC